jgi:hypothetical protein
MTTFLELRTAAANLNTAAGDLGKRYDANEALALASTIKMCLPIVGESLSETSTQAQQIGRGDIHKLCLTLDAAIRQAIAYPSRTEMQDATVNLVRDLHLLFARHRDLLGL